MLSWRLLTTLLSLLGLVYYLQGRERVVHRRREEKKQESLARD